MWPLERLKSRSADFPQDDRAVRTPCQKSMRVSHQYRHKEKNHEYYFP